MAAAAPPALEGSLVGRQVFSADNWWNLDVSAAPLDSNSAAFINFISGRSSTNPDRDGRRIPTSDRRLYGIPYVVVSEISRRVTPTWTASDGSDGVDTRRAPLPVYPIPDEAKTQPNYIEGGVPGGGSSGDRHMLIVDRDHWLLFETGATRWNANAADGRPTAARSSI